MPIAVLDLSQFLSGVTSSVKRFPSLIHSTKGSNIYSIIENGKIDAKPCSVFDGENLAYFFVGRPAYKGRELAVSDFWLTPVAFVFKNPLPVQPKRIFPFDSGAFVDRRLGDEFADFDLNRFEVAGEYVNIGKIIKVFFGSSTKYMCAQARQRERIAKQYKIGPNGFSILALASLLLKSASATHDDRNSVIEVQFDNPIDLVSPNLKGIVLAEEWLSDPDLDEALKSIGCIVKTYPLYPLSSHSYYSKIYESCEAIENA